MELWLQCRSCSRLLCEEPPRGVTGMIHKCPFCLWTWPRDDGVPGSRNDGNCNVDYRKPLEEERARNEQLVQQHLANVRKKNEEIDMLKKGHQKEVAQIQERNRVSVEGIMATHKEEIDKLKRDHEKHVEELLECQRAATDAIMSNHDAVVEHLQRKVKPSIFGELRVPRPGATLKEIRDALYVALGKGDELSTKTEEPGPELSQAAQTVGSLERSLEADKGKRQELSTETEELRSQLTQAVQNVEPLERALEEEKGKREELATETEELRSQLSQAAQNVGSLKRSLEEEKEKREELAKEMEGLRPQLSQAAQNVGSLERSLEEEKGKNLVLKRKLTDARRQNAGNVRARRMRTRRSCTNNSGYRKFVLTPQQRKIFTTFVTNKKKEDWGTSNNDIVRLFMNTSMYQALKDEQGKGPSEGAMRNWAGEVVNSMPGRNKQRKRGK